ncbi:hypothetical protein LSH36_532g05004 [Paralvinella palmiformis]|uniref:Uncharacterized protein n=1 Tax=Paralvinella palmiformis TaxID=53620 RepID=A0AAD9MYN4_9ANNE|nr:hypothetical protein LSH36_532g05004 [Paralvinella palmiformis]
MANARSKAEQADMSARKSREDSDQARLKAKEYAPEFHQPDPRPTRVHHTLSNSHCRVTPEEHACPDTDTSRARLVNSTSSGHLWTPP